MGKSKSSISKARSYQEIGEYWDTHDLSEHWSQTKPVDFEVDIQTEAKYYPIERKLSAEITRIAKRRGVSAETLLNMWLQEKIGEETTMK